MKNLLLGVCAISFVGMANAEVVCGDDSFSGLFAGIGGVVSFDNNKSDLSFAANSAVDGARNANRTHGAVHYKKNKNAIGGQIVLGYGHQFDSNLYVAIMHESYFTSKAVSEHVLLISENAVADNNGAAGTFVQGSNGAVLYRTGRKCWTPSFGLAMGYVVDGWNFGLRGGMTMEKYKIEQIASPAPAAAAIGGQAIPSTTKSVSATSPYVGAYVEYKMGSFIGYLNVDRVFGKKKTEAMGNTTANSAGAISVRNKRASWRAAAGIKMNVNFMN